MPRKIKKYNAEDMAAIRAIVSGILASNGTIHNMDTLRSRVGNAYTVAETAIEFDRKVRESLIEYHNEGQGESD